MGYRGKGKILKRPKPRLEPRGVATFQELRLFDPAIAADTPGERPQLRVDAVHVGFAPTGYLGVAGDAELVQQSLKLRPDPLDLTEIVGC